MNYNQTLLDTPSTFRSLYWPVAIVLALLVGLLWLMGYGPGGMACQPPVVAMRDEPQPMVTSPAVVAAPTPVPTPPPAAAPEVKAMALPPAEKIYFAVNSSVVNASSSAQLAGIVAYLKANPSAKAVLSGFHDPSGNKAANEELALNRARAVRSALDSVGIPKERVEMAKPIETTGNGAPEEARRVDVNVIP
jgi:K(+)-stimulated pyrophosphate-energized sodium pump